MPPARPTVQMLLAYAKAISDALTVGIRNSFVGSPSALGRPANTVRTTAADAQTASVVFMPTPPCVNPKGFAPRTPPHARSRSRLRRSAPFAWLARSHSLALGAADGTIFRPVRTFRRALLAFVLLTVIAYGGVVVWLIANETRLVFEAGQAAGTYRPAPPFEEMSVRGTTGPRQRIWIMRTSASAEASADTPWVIFLHGNAASIASRMNIVHYEHLRALGLNVIAPEYRGYGGVEGVPTEAGIESDARAAYDTVQERLHLDSRRIVLYGWSLGSAVAVDLASHVPSAAVILEGAPASIVAIGERRYPLLPIRLLIRNPFESIRKIDGVKAPKLFIHSLGDEIVPIEEGRRLFDAAPQPKRWVEVTGGHVYAAEKDPAFFGYVRQFLAAQGLVSAQEP